VYSLSIVLIRKKNKIFFSEMKERKKTGVLIKSLIFSTICRVGCFFYCIDAQFKGVMSCRKNVDNFCGKLDIHSKNYKFTYPLI
jgi:hypothetical protein